MTILRPKAGNPGRGSESVLAEERKLTLERDSGIMGHVEGTTYTQTHTCMIDFTRIKGGFIRKSVVNGGRKYG